MTLDSVVFGISMLFAGMIVGWQLHGVERVNPDADDEPVEKPK